MLGDAPMNALLAVSNAIRALLERVAEWSGWLLVVLMTVTCVDVTCRKFGIPIPYTMFQEMEWHLHTAIFAMWMGYNYTINAHPRVDSYTEALPFRKKAWIELAGILLFALPYTVVIIYYGWDFVKTAYVFNERSDSAIGLSYRWIIKGVLYVGVWLVLLGVVSVLLRLIAYLFGKRTPEQAGLQIGHSVSEV